MSFTISLKNALANYQDSQVYWAILAKNRQDQFCHMTSDGTMIPMSEDDNTNPVGTNKNCSKTNEFANYFSTLQELPEFTIPDDAFVNSGQIWIALDDWLPICVNQPNGMGYAPPSVTNPGLQGYNTIFQMAEFAYNVYGHQQLNADTTSVDYMGFPITMTLNDSNSNPQTVGFTVNRSQLLTDFQNCPNPHFKSLIMGDDLRILSPEHAARVPHGYNPPPDMGLSKSVIDYFSDFYTEYIEQCWTHYTSQPVTINITGTPYTGQVQNNVFNFWAGTTIGDPSAIVCHITKPLNWEVLQCAGQFKTGTPTQQNIKKFVVSAMYRTVFMETPTDPCNSWGSEAMQQKYYTNEPINYYASILHANSMKSKTPQVWCGESRSLVNGLCYAFAFDDVCDQSSSVVSTTTKSLELTLTAWS